MITGIVNKDNHRLPERFRVVSGDPAFRETAGLLMETDRPVCLVTGFFIPGVNRAETDGPPGALALANALKTLGKTPVIVTDALCAPVVEAVAGDAHELVIFPSGQDAERTQRAFAQRLLKTLNPGIIIAIERPGPDVRGRFLTMHGEDITPFAAGPHYLFTEAAQEVTTVGIGDGGNELGMGALAEILPDAPYISFIPAHYTLVGTTSNMAVYGLLAFLEMISGESTLLPDGSWLEIVYRKMLDAGAVDGITQEPELSTDGIPLLHAVKTLDALRQASRLHRELERVLYEFSARQRERYGVSIARFHVSPPRPPTHRYSICGEVLLPRQEEMLEKLLSAAGVPAELQLKRLAQTPPAGSRYMAPARRLLDVFDRPEGKLATQVDAWDPPVRILWKHARWRLVQTADLTLGWCPESTLRPATKTGKNPWEDVVRIPKGRLVEVTFSPDAFMTYALTYLDTPYRLGGRSREGLDCSGLVSLVFRKFGLTVPRNSAEQQKLGIRIPISNAAACDLVFALARNKRIRHVAVNTPNGLLHASLTRGKVLLEPRDAFLAHYAITAVRRLMGFPRRER